MPTELEGNQNNEELETQEAEKEEATQDASQLTKDDDPKERERLWLEAFREQHQRSNRLEAQYAALERTNKELLEKVNTVINPPPSPEDRDKKYWERPSESIAATVREEIERSITPIANEFRAQTRVSKYDEIKNAFRTNDTYKGVFSKLESSLDKVMIEGGVEPTPQNVKMIVDTMIGQIALGQLIIPGVDLNAKAPVNNQEEDIPHIRSSPPDAPKPKDKGKVKVKLTEAQRRMARINNMTDEDFIHYLNDDTMEVDFMAEKAKRDREKAKGGNK